MGKSGRTSNDQSSDKNNAQIVDGKHTNKEHQDMLNNRSGQIAKNKELSDLDNIEEDGDPFELYDDPFELF